MESVKPALVVLAAGLGSRYGGLKQLDPVGPAGETLMDYSVFDALRAGFARLVFVIRRDMAAAFQEQVGVRFESRLPVSYAFQELDQLPAGYTVPAGRTQPWGTAHALWCAADAVRTPFATINADDFYGADAFRLLARHLQSDTPDYALVGFTLRHTLSEHGRVARALCQVNGASYLRAVVEHTALEWNGDHARDTSFGHEIRFTGDEAVSMNLWGFHPTVFALLEGQFREFLQRHGLDTKAECYLPDAVSALVRNGQAKVKVLRTAASWFGVTYREDRPRVMTGIQRLIAQGDYPERLWM